MAIYLSAGVYVKEVDLSNVPPGLPPSIGAIVGASKKGPIDKPYMITDPTNFTKRFGEPDPKISWMHYAAIAFLQEANQLLVLRIAGANHLFGGVLLQYNTPAAADTATLLAFESEDPKDIDFETAGAVDAPEENLAYFYAEGPGSYADNLEIEIVTQNLVAPEPVLTPSEVGGILPNGTYSYIVSAFNINSESETSVAVVYTFQDGSGFSGTSGFSGVSGFSGFSGHGTTSSVKLTWDPVPNATGYKVYGRTGGSEGLLATVGTVLVNGKITYTDTGAAVVGIDPPDDLASTDLFIVNVYDMLENATIPVESFLCSLVDGLDGYGQQMELESRINPYSSYIRVKSNATTVVDAGAPTLRFIAPDGTNRAAMEGGDSGDAVTSTQIAVGWTLFQDPEQWDVTIFINGGYSDPIVQLSMDTVAHRRGDSVAILDTPSASQTVQAALDYRRLTLNLNSNRSALYTPDLLIQDVYNSRSLYVPPSGHMAGVYARTDRVADPWYAPAGLNRGLLSVLGVRQRYNQGDRDFLAPNQVNYVRVFPGMGYAVWEQHTLQAHQSALSWVSVRRMLDVMEKAISRALLVSVHEPNDDFLRRQIITMCEDYLQVLKNRRAVKKFLVVCDDTNNPPYLTDIGQLNVDVFVTPILPAEKIQLKVIITRQGARFEELIAAGALQI